MSFRVAIIGHSQVPTSFLAIPGIEIRIFRRSGAKLQYFSEYLEFQEVFTWPHDYNIVFLGGNDINVGPQSWSAARIARDLINLSWQFVELNQKVSLVLIEPRRYIADFVHYNYKKE